MTHTRTMFHYTLITKNFGRKNFGREIIGREIFGRFFGKFRTKSQNAFFLFLVVVSKKWPISQLDTPSSLES